MPPDLTLEAGCHGVTAGIDEAGRGPLAGPVVAAALVLPAADIPAGIDDSKRLTRARREALAGALHAVAMVGIGRAEVEEIDRINILQASLLAMRRAVQALPLVPDWALVDGPHLPRLACPARAVIGGDRHSLSIAAASICAKVARDRIMTELARRHPHYGWETNAGYGTAAHRAALTRYGVTAHHRRSFAPVRAILDQESPVTD